MKLRNRASCRGFTLIEVLIVATIIGLIVAIAIPNLINALQRSRQSRTISDIRTISQGLAMYDRDHTEYPRAASLEPLTNISEGLVMYVGQPPVNDGWGQSFLYRSDGRAYTVASVAANGLIDPPWTLGTTTRFDDDIVIIDGNFFQMPYGVQN
jgi:general secretion pathway protein G